METPADEVHVIAPENLPPDLAQDAPPIYPKNWPREIKLKVVAQVVKEGGSLPEVAAKYPPLSVPQLRGWVQAYKMEVTSMENPTENKAKPKPQARRTFTEKEKILYAVRFNRLKKQGIAIVDASKQLGVHETQLREWVKTFDTMKPQKRGAYTRIEEGTNGKGRKGQLPIEPRHREASALIDKGGEIREIAKKFGVHRDSIKAWWLKVNPGKKWTYSNAGGAGKGRGSQYDIEDKERAVERVANGDLFADVAADLGIVAPSTVREWWRRIKGNDDWPSQVGRKNTRTIAAKKDATRKPYKPSGPNKMTRNKMSVREAILSNSKVMTAQETQVASATEYMNGHPQPISTGKAMHDAIVFLKMARELATKQVKTGAMQVDDPLILFPMLALNALSK